MILFNYLYSLLRAQGDALSRRGGVDISERTLDVDAPVRAGEPPEDLRSAPVELRMDHPEGVSWYGSGVGGRPNLLILCQNFNKFRSFSGVSAPIFASKYAFFSILQNLQDYLAEVFEMWQNFGKFSRFTKHCLIFTKNADFSNRFLAKILRLQR